MYVCIYTHTYDVRIHIYIYIYTYTYKGWASFGRRSTAEAGGVELRSSHRGKRMRDAGSLAPSFTHV